MSDINLPKNRLTGKILTVFKNWPEMDFSDHESKDDFNKEIKLEEISEDTKPPLHCDTLKTEDISVVKNEDTTVKLERPKIKFTCPYCPFRSDRKNKLRMHIINKHTTISDSTWYKCSQCSFEGATRDQLTEHMISEHQPKSVYLCPHCPFKTKEKSSLQNHVIVKHTPDEDIKWFQCGLCEYRGKCRHNLIHHFKMRHLEKVEVFQCTECDYSTKVKRNLMLHVKSRHSADRDDIKWIKCDFCSHITKRKYYLKLHMMSKHPLM